MSRTRYKNGRFKRFKKLRKKTKKFYKRRNTEPLTLSNSLFSSPRAKHDDD